jgi:hypothetical protein
MALEISVWEEKITSNQKQTQQTANTSQINCNLLGETVIPLESAIYQNRGSEWWPLLSINSLQQTSTKPNVNTFQQQQQITQSNKLNQLQPNQLQDRCNSASAEYLRK